MYEVELKFAVDDADAIRLQITDLGASPLEIVDQCDVYFGHPSRSFAESDEALRIRSTGDAHRVTYKGPVIDDATKMRKEIEIDLLPGEQSAAGLRAILVSLGFEPVRQVHKQRQRFQLSWSQREFELAIDRIEGLGTFVELETLATTDDRDGARDAVLELADRLVLTSPERRSYLEMLLQHDRETNRPAGPSCR